MQIRASAHRWMLNDRGASRNSSGRHAATAPSKSKQAGRPSPPPTRYPRPRRGPQRPPRRERTCALVLAQVRSHSNRGRAGTQGSRSCWAQPMDRTVNRQRTQFMHMRASNRAASLGSRGGLHQRPRLGARVRSRRATFEPLSALCCGQPHANPTDQGGPSLE